MYPAQYYSPNYGAYAQMQTPYQQVPQAAQPQPVAQSNIQWVQGIEATKSYLVGAGNSVMLMDSEASTFYIKSTDSAGMPQPMRIFDYKERKAQDQPQNAVEYVTKKEFEERLAALKEVKTDE